LGYGIPNLQLALNKALLSEGSKDDNSEIKIFPNPTDRIIYFELPSNEMEFSVQLYDILGKHVFELYINFEQRQIDISSLSSGIYIAKVQSKELSKSFKIIKI
jgi:serine protease AprX